MMSEIEYYSGLHRLEVLAPQHPLLQVAARGYNAVNCHYLTTALKSIKEQPVVNKLPQNIEQLQVMRSQMYARRAKLSNSFADCNNDDERAIVSQHIEALQEEIIEIKRAINAVKNNEIIDAPVTPEIVTSIDLPEDPVLLKNKLLSLRSQISNKRAIIRRIMSDPAKKGKKPLDRHEEELRVLQLNLAHVERVINSTKEKVQ